MRFEIIGNIASGKTTLANLMNKSIQGVFENFQENPFWESFYRLPEFYSFETELTFTLQHYHQIKDNISSGNSFICDFSLTLDRSYADVTLSSGRNKIYRKVLDELVDEVGKPDFMIYLKCPEHILLNRIIARGRDTEKTITIDYLESLAASIDENVKLLGLETDLIVLDSCAMNFAHDRACAEQVIETVSRYLG